MLILDPCLMLAGKMMDEFTTKDKQAGSHEYNTVQQRGYSAHININNRRLVSSVGRAPVCKAGGHGFKPRPDQHLGSLNNRKESAAFEMTFANG